jgi:AraC-like DNA-binding protein
VVVDLGGSRGDPLLAAGLAREFPSAAFFAITPFRPVDAPAIAECAEHGVADVLADGVDDAVLGPVAIARGFSSRFAVALADPPSELGLTSTLHLGAWRRIVTRAGQPVRTQELAASLGVTREHLSRSFALGPAATLKRTIDLVRLLAAAALAKNSGCDLRDVARILGYPSRSQLATTSLRLLGTPAESLARLRGVDVVGRIVASRE